MKCLTEMSPFERMEFYRAKIDRVTPSKTIYEQRMRMVYTKLLEEEDQQRLHSGKKGI